VVHVRKPAAAANDFVALVGGDAEDRDIRTASLEPPRARQCFRLAESRPLPAVSVDRAMRSLKSARAGSARNATAGGLEAVARWAVCRVRKRPAATTALWLSGQGGVCRLSCRWHVTSPETWR